MCFKLIKISDDNYYMCCKCYYITEFKANCKFHKCTKELLQLSKQYKEHINGKLIIDINEIIKNYNINKNFKIYIDN